jgi:hypothetical protein
MKNRILRYYIALNSYIIFPLLLIVNKGEMMSRRPAQSPRWPNKVRQGPQTEIRPDKSPRVRIREQPFGKRIRLPLESGKGHADG